MSGSNAPMSSDPSHPHQTIVGREREQLTLLRALDQMREGHGRLILIDGQAGIGKTTLVEWLAREAAADCRVLRGGCYDLTSTPPYGPWLEAARAYSHAADEPLLPDLLVDPTALVRIGSQAELFERVSDFLADLASSRPTLLILEDLHWADPGSIGLLRHIARDIGKLRVLVIVTHRAEDLSRQHPLFMLTPLLVREAEAERIGLRPLSDVETRALARGLYLLPENDQVRLDQFLTRRSEGNPLYANELLRTLEDEGVLALQHDGTWQLGDPEQLRVPLFVLQVIERRMSRLDRQTRDLLQVAAMIGEDVPYDLWLPVSQAPEDALQSAIQHGQEARIIAESPGKDSYRFRHGLMRQALYEEVVAPRRRLWHRRIAEILTTLPQPDPDAVAFHFQQAHDPRAASWLVTAGERAERAYAWITAADRFDDAIAILDEQNAPASTRAWLRLRTARLRRYVNPVASLSLMREARRITVDAGEAALASFVLFNVGVLECSLSYKRQGLATMDQAMIEYQALSDEDRASLASAQQVDQVVLEGRMVAWLASAGRLTEAIDKGTRVIEALSRRIQQTGQGASALGDVWDGLAVARGMLGEPELAREAFRQARSIYQASEHHAMVAMCCANELEEVQLPYFSEDRAMHNQLSSLGETSAKKASGAVAGSVGPRIVSLDLLVRNGSWSEAREFAEAAYAERLAPVWIIGSRCLALLSCYQGDFDRALQIVHEVHPEGPETEPGNVYLPTGLLMQRLAADIALEQNNPPVARAWLEAHDRWLGWSGAVLGHAEGELGWAEYEHRVGNDAASRGRAQRALAAASDPYQSFALIAIHRFLAQLDLAMRRFGEAEAHLSESLARAEACGAPLERALTQLRQAELFLLQGRTADSRALLDEVRSAFEQLNARPALVHMDDFNKRLAVVEASSVYPAGLTRREVDVLRLVAQGMTDSEVAEELFLSPRTVSAHLRSVYNKIGVGSRAAATRFASEHNLI